LGKSVPHARNPEIHNRTHGTAAVAVELCGSAVVPVEPQNRWPSLPKRYYFWTIIKGKQFVTRFFKKKNFKKV